MLIKSILSIFILCSFVAFHAEAKKAKTPAVKEPTSDPVQLVNVVLFSDDQQSWTWRDYQLFLLLKQESLKKEFISKYSKEATEDFIMSRLMAREAQLFDLTPAALSMSDSLRKRLNNYSSAEVVEETKTLGYALTMTDIKEGQLKEPQRFQAWVEALKKKYQVKRKWSPTSS